MLTTKKCRIFIYVPSSEWTIGFPYKKNKNTKKENRLFCDSMTDGAFTACGAFKLRQEISVSTVHLFFVHFLRKLFFFRLFANEEWKTAFHIYVATYFEWSECNVDICIVHHNHKTRCLWWYHENMSIFLTFSPSIQLPKRFRSYHPSFALSRM